MARAYADIPIQRDGKWTTMGALRAERIAREQQAAEKKQREIAIVEGIIAEAKAAGDHQFAAINRAILRTVRR